MSIKTRFLIISDTHGLQPSPSSPHGFRHPLPEADVALHCGDLTLRSQLPEYAATLSLLRSLSAPLKLFIAGNHDRALDLPHWHNRSRDADLPPQVQQLIRDAEQDGVRYLTEGVYDFELRNGARLRIYASQFTPDFGGWAFQYFDSHDFDIPPGVDIAMTHGPPLGVLDESRWAQADGSHHAGCGHLIKALHRAKPKIHCFGHIHEAWGAYLAKWNDAQAQGPAGELDAMELDESDSLIDMSNSHAIWDLDKFDLATEDVASQQGLHIDLTHGETRLEHGQQTLFLNAAVVSVRYHPVQQPWVVDVDLPLAITGGATQ